ncbi:MAG TPA: hypothetical protein VF602_03405 [Pedobacter sp.]|jgi:hypothetical protein
MACLTAKDKIHETFNQVRDTSFEEKVHLTEEHLINNFLDHILDFKSKLSSKTERINTLVEKLEVLTWLNDPIDDECLKLINDLIASARDLHYSLIRRYVEMNHLRAKGIAKDEIKSFKNSIDDLKDIFIDLESVFFHLPNIPSFKQTTRELSLL